MTLCRLAGCVFVGRGEILGGELLGIATDAVSSTSNWTILTLTRIMLCGIGIPLRGILCGIGIGIPLCFIGRRLKDLIKFGVLDQVGVFPLVCANR